MSDPGLAASPIIPVLFMIAIFYFIVFRPEQKRKKDLKQMIDGMKKNDQVVTSAGIHGTVIQTKEKTVIIRVDDNVKIEFDKESILSVTKVV
jgi:preprotein translocase subunit YajC